MRERMAFVPSMYRECAECRGGALEESMDIQSTRSQSLIGVFPNYFKLTVTFLEAKRCRFCNVGGVKIYG